MKTDTQNRSLGIGLLIILIGLAFLLRQLHLLPPGIEDIIISWQMLLIVIGIYNVFFNESRIFGFILIAVGGFFLLPELFDLPFNFIRNFWPIVLIVVGLFILFKAGIFGKEPRIRPAEGSEMDYINEVNIFSGSEKKYSIRNFRGGKITSIFGGSDIDLSGSTLAEGNPVIELFYMFGGSTIVVPNDWVVVNNVTSILGGFSDKRRVATEAKDYGKNTLILKGFVMLGGGEIKGH